MAGNQTRAPSANRLTVWHLALLIPYVAVLWVPFYNRIEPSAFGIPFFYLYQIAWVIISSVLIALVYGVTRRG